MVILDRGHNRPGYGYTVMNVSQKLADDGVKSLADIGKLKGKRIGVNALGSINHYNTATALIRAEPHSTKHVHW